MVKDDHAQSTFRPAIVDWGYLPYRDAHERQLAALEDRIAGRIEDTIFFVEHPHVYTYGRGTTGAIPSSPTTPINPNEPVEHVRVERGGDVTYHGPGQMVAYPIVDVRALTGDLHAFLHWLEDVLIATIAQWRIEGRHDDTHTGVWVGDRKIASIGVAVRKWISYHGIALNVSTDLRYFGAVNPCGLPAGVMTSMELQTGEIIPIADINSSFIAAIQSYTPAPIPIG